MARCPKSISPEESWLGMVSSSRAPHSRGATCGMRRSSAAEMSTGRIGIEVGALPLQAEAALSKLSPAKTAGPPGAPGRRALSTTEPACAVSAPETAGGTAPGPRERNTEAVAFAGCPRHRDGRAATAARVEGCAARENRTQEGGSDSSAQRDSRSPGGAGARRLTTAGASGCSGRATACPTARMERCGLPAPTFAALRNCWGERVARGGMNSADGGGSA